MPHIEKSVELNFGKEWDKKKNIQNQNQKEEPAIKKRMPFKPMIAIPSPRDIDEVKQNNKNLPYMKLWIKYHTEGQAYQIIRKEFLSNDKFSHLIIMSDDLVVPKEKLDMLIEDVKNLPDTHFDNSVVCGFCNVNTTDGKADSNISHYLQSPDPKKRDYRFLSLEECRNFPIPPENPKILGEKLNSLFRVKFAGFPCFIIPRKIIENIVFRNDSASGVDESGCCVDVMFCYDMHQHDYDIFVDKRVELKHLRYSREAITSFHLKDKDKHVFWDNGEPKKEKVESEDKKDILSWKDDDYGF